MTQYTADPTEKLDYTIDWSAVLESGETITASTWTVPTGITQTTPAPSFTDTTATVWLTGGTVSTRYKVENHVTTSAGREYEDSIHVLCVDK